MTARTPDAWRSLFAEVRAVESGHNARWSDTDRCFLVASDSEPGVNRQVTVGGVKMAGDLVYLVLSCSCPQGRRGQQISYGMTGCKHAATVARRLERERLARWESSNSRWVARGALHEAGLAAAFDTSNDPSATLDAPGHRAKGPAWDDQARVAEQIRNSL